MATLFDGMHRLSVTQASHVVESAWLHECRVGMPDQLRAPCSTDQSEGDVTFAHWTKRESPLRDSPVLAKAFLLPL